VILHLPPATPLAAKGGTSLADDLVATFRCYLDAYVRSRVWDAIAAELDREKAA
jgi:hypothetical protein